VEAIFKPTEGVSIRPSRLALMQKSTVTKTVQTTDIFTINHNSTVVLAVSKPLIRV